MGDYFKPLRRKIGVLTLVMACVLTAFWIRSNATLDMIRVGIGSRWLHSTVSASFDSGPSMTQSSLSVRSKLKEDYPGFGPFFSWTAQSTKDAIRGPILDAKTKWRWHGNGFDFGFQHQEGGFADDTIAVIVPHWSIVIPLTLLSALLLLAKPRKSIQKKIQEPTPVEGT